MKVICMSGIPGAGKSFNAAQLCADVTVSADRHLRGTNFGEAHAKCFKDYLAALSRQTPPLIVVDNTNTQAWEIAPYALAAAAYGATFIIRRVITRPELAWQRQTHNVPMFTFCTMVANFNKRDVMPFWSCEEVVGG